MVWWIAFFCALVLLVPFVGGGNVLAFARRIELSGYTNIKTTLATQMTMTIDSILRMFNIKQALV